MPRRQPAATALGLVTRSVLAAVAAALAVVAPAGCGRTTAPAAKTLAISEVPAAFLETARKELPGVNFTDVWVKKDGTLEIRGRAANGKVREVEIRPDGSVAEIE